MIKYLIACLFGLLSFHLVLAQSEMTFEEKVHATAEKLSTSAPNMMDPVTLNSTLVKSKDSIAVIVKADILSNWHIYAFVGKGHPYIVTDKILELPEGLQTLGDWQTPSAAPYQKGVYVYKGTSVFIQYLKMTDKVKEDAIITAGLYYQTCCNDRCLRPTRKVFELNP